MKMILKRLVTALSLLLLTSSIVLAQNPFTATGTLSAAATSVTLNLGGYVGVGVQVTGTCGSCTLNFEATLDGTNWVAVNMTPPSSTTAVTTATAVGAWNGAIVGRTFRVRMSARSSGSFVINIRATPVSASSDGGGGGGTPGGSDTQVQFNDGDLFGGDAGLTFLKGPDTLTVVGSVVTPFVTSADTSTVRYGYVSLSDGSVELASQHDAFGASMTLSAEGWLAPNTDNVYDLGNEFQAWRTGYFGTSLEGGGTALINDVAGVGIGTAGQSNSARFGSASGGSLVWESTDPDNAYINLSGGNNAGIGDFTLTVQNPVGPVLAANLLLNATYANLASAGTVYITSDANGDFPTLTLGVDGALTWSGALPISAVGLTRDGDDLIISTTTSGNIIASAVGYISLVSDSNYEVRLTPDGQLLTPGFNSNQTSTEFFGSVIATDFANNSGDLYITTNSGALYAQSSSNIGLNSSDGGTASLNMTGGEIYLNANEAGKRIYMTSNTGVVANAPVTATAFTTAGSSPAVANIGANSCGTTAATPGGTDNAPTITVGATAGTACRLTFDTTAPNGWNCTWSNKSTHTLAATPFQSADTATTADVTAATAFGAGDVLTGTCFAR